MNDNLNLARKWRPQTFEQIIGQELSVSMLKNSLYLKKLFPVYLFSGQRGCGKTSSARVFGCAINCKNLSAFQTDAKAHTVPCLECESCKSMLNGSHPDFIEIDAASHTGVDNVRQIIESCAYMPLSGLKKIYLIDEAHMLSKAAFNAFLKILEEPPMSAIFILATTEFAKLPETVRSRCFHVPFYAVSKKVLAEHVQTICAKENISVEQDAVDLLIQETDGSVRDTLNALEQVRFGGTTITRDLVLRSLGKISENMVAALLDAVIKQDAKKVLEQLKVIDFPSLVPQNVWGMTVNLLRAMLWFKHGVEFATIPTTADETTLKNLADQCSVNKIHALLQMLWAQEASFLQTPYKHQYFELALLTMCQQTNIEDLKDLLAHSQAAGPQLPVGAQMSSTTSSVQPRQVQPAPLPQTTVTPTPEVPASPKTSAPPGQPWQDFLASLEQTVNDGMLTSILKQAELLPATGTTLNVQIGTNSPFVTDKVMETENSWKSLLLAQFPTFQAVNVSYKAIASKPAATPAPKAPSAPFTPPPRPAAAPQYHGQQYHRAKPAASEGPSGTPFVIPDPEKWPKATLLTKTFSGKLEKVSDNK